MRLYKHVEISERELEDFIRQAPGLIEEGLRYVDHQRRTDRGPLDLLLVDSGKALVVAELKVVEHDDMLWQGIDYYDYITRHVDGFARAYHRAGIDPEQAVRLFLIAQSFSLGMLNRCKWIDIPISLFTFTCITFQDSDEVTPVFKEAEIPSPPEPAPTAYTLKQHFEYVTNPEMRALMEGLVKEIQSWDPVSVVADPIKYHISLKASGRVLAYVSPRRNFFCVGAHNSDGEWEEYPVRQEDDLAETTALLKENFEKLTS